MTAQRKARAMGSHQSTAMISDTWLTPPYIVEALGPFDLDPCCPPDMPWRTAATMLTKAEDGLAAPWQGRVWLNPPYSSVARAWMRKLVEHGVGTALIFARTETEWFRETVWRAATAVLFLHGRLHFHNALGVRAFANAGAPSCLIAYGTRDADILAGCGLEGQFVPLLLPRLVAVALLPPGTWREVLLELMRRRRGPVALADLYRALASHPKARANPHWREKARQVLQRGPFRRVARGQWEACA